MGDILMSAKERKRLELLSRVKDRQITLVKVAELLGLSYRQVKRCWGRYKVEGDAGLVHRLRGKNSPRGKAPKLRRRVLERYRQRYGDFGPTLAAEHLAKEGLRVDHETLRRWLLAEGLWVKRRHRRKHRQWRERKPCAGEMVQMDGSHHDWFEGRRAPAVLMVMIDDATNTIHARFSEEETTEAAYDVFESYCQRQGCPQSLYVDRDSIYRTDRAPTLEEELKGQEPKTQFGRAMEKLGVTVLCAYSPQAKGRVERSNGTLQDRLVKALRLAGISSLGAANEFLEKTFLPEFNERFALPAANAANLHRRVNLRLLRQSLCWEDRRVVQNDWTVRWNNQWFQIGKDNGALSLPGKAIVLRKFRDGALRLEYQGQALNYKTIAHKPEPPPPPMKPRVVVRPPPEHPWRRFGVATSSRFWKKQRRTGAAAAPL